MSFLKGLRSFDAYPKLHDDMKVKTFSGAAVSIFACIFIGILFFSELNYYLTTETVDHLYVDTTRGEKININFNISFARIPCSVLSLDAMDVSGTHQLDVSHHIMKKPLDSDGNIIGMTLNHALSSGDHGDGDAVQQIPEDPTKKPGYCGSCYGAESRPNQCCNSCDQVKNAYRTKGWAISSLSAIEQCILSGSSNDDIHRELARNEGCRMYGYLSVKKVAGNFHFAPGKSFQHSNLHIHDLASFDTSKFNVSHTVHHLSFGDIYPGVINPLDDTEKRVPDNVGAAMYMYYNKVVPTSYSYLDGRTVDTNQFSVTEHFRPVAKRQGQGLPGVFFFYELSPIMVKFAETRNSLPHFLTQLCAILGGVFTVAGMVDRLVYHGIRHMEKKMQIGKLI